MMDKTFIQLYDDNFDTYIVNINNISVIDVGGLKKSGWEITEISKYAARVCSTSSNGW